MKNSIEFTEQERARWAIGLTLDSFVIFLQYLSAEAASATGRRWDMEDAAAFHAGLGAP